MINNRNETKKATISVNSNSPSKPYKEGIKDTLVVGGFYTPTNQIKDNKDKSGELHPGWLGNYKPEFAKNGFTILSQYNFNYTRYHCWVAKMGVYLRPRDHTLIIYRTDQPLSYALVKLKKMVKDNAYISDLYFEKISPYDR